MDTGFDDELDRRRSSHSHYTRQNGGDYVMIELIQTEKSS